MTERRPRAIVIGGGVSGLAAAHRLVSRGDVDVILLEGSERLGGKVRTERHDGFVVEAGPDSFVAPKQSVLELAAELGIGDQVVSSRPENRGSWVWSRQRLHPLPEGLLLMAPARLGPIMDSSLLSWKGKARLLGDLVLPRRTREGDESLKSFVDRRLGSEVLDRIAQPLVAGIHAAQPETMSLQASFPRFLDMEREHRSLILAARRATKNAPPPTGMSHFASFRDGMGTLVGALEKSLAGAEVRTGARVEAVTRGLDGYTVTIDGAAEPADAVILAVPAAETARLLAGVSDEAARTVGQIRQVSTAMVTLAYKADDMPSLGGYGFVVPSVENRRVTGVTYLSQKWEGRAGPDTVLLRAFVRRAEATLPPDEQVALVRQELAVTAGITAEPVFVTTHSWEDGLHQYTLGHLDRVAAVEAALVDHPNLRLAGAAFYGIGLNECVSSGRAAADALLP